MRQPYKLGSLTGYALQARDGEIGKLKQIYFDDQYWMVRYFVVHTGSWLLGQDVLIAPVVVTAVDEENQCLEVNLTREQIKNCPPLNAALPVSRHYEQEYYRYYGWEPYWGDASLIGRVPVMPPVSAAAEEPQEPEHPHLHSSEEVTGYHIHAHDDDIGHVEDFIVEAPDWEIRYLEVDTRNWLPGKHVLVEPAWIRQVDWANQKVTVDLLREAIETAPPYDPDKILSREYQVALYSHYGMTFDRG